MQMMINFKEITDISEFFLIENDFLAIEFLKLFFN